MSDAKHTPGPWVVTGVSMTTGNVSVGMKEHSIVIAEVTNAASFGDMLAGAMRRGGGGFSQSDCHTQFANASLIAAAPDLLAVAKHCEEILTRYEINRIDGEEIADAALSLLRHAIARAEGRA